MLRSSYDMRYEWVGSDLVFNYSITFSKTPKPSCKLLTPKGKRGVLSCLVASMEPFAHDQHQLVTGDNHTVYGVLRTLLQIRPPGGLLNGVISGSPELTTVHLVA